MSGTGKELLDKLCDSLEVDRPQAIKIALAKGISNATGTVPDGDYNDHKQKWTIPDNIIRDKEYLLYKHLIINEIQTSLSDEETSQHFLYFIEYGLRITNNEIDTKSSLESYRIKVLK